MAITHELSLRAFRQFGILRPRDLIERGGHPTFLELYTTLGSLQRLGPGLYGDAHETYGPTIRAAVRWRSAVLCLDTALWVHGIIPAEPESPALAIGAKAWKPIETYGARFLRMRGGAFTECVERWKLRGVDIGVFGLAKTLADCFAFRRLLASGFPAWALTSALERRRCTAEEVLAWAARRRVGRIVAAEVAAIRDDRTPR